jgi:mono/diheme cytochrome c family protein
MKSSRSMLAFTLSTVAAAAVVIWALFTGFYGTQKAGSSQFRSATGPVPKQPQRSGDPQAGYRALLNAPYVSCGIPYQAYQQLNPDVPEQARLEGREGRNQELPYALTSHVDENGVEIVANNCLTCHAGEIDGKLIVGLGNEFGDFTQDPRRLSLQIGNYVAGDSESAAWTFWADRIEGIAPFIQTKTVGVNPAPNLTWALMSHLDPETLKWSENTLIEPPPKDPLPISVPPWWGMKKKNAMFYTTIGRGDHSRFMLLASMLCIDGFDEAAKIDQYAPDIRAYITTLEAPEYPFPIDRELAGKGEAIFVAECSKCHGTYGENESYPNEVYPIDEVKTDPHYARESTDGSRDRFFEWITRSPYGDTENAAPAPGYIAPPLDGVWATAPYLHNGSIPTMAALLSSRDRPKYWRVHVDSRRFDPEAMGWSHDVLNAGQSAESDPTLRRLIYDTTLRGYGNMGHTYGDKLNESGRAALLEYLKTL